MTSSGAATELVQIQILLKCLNCFIRTVPSNAPVVSREFKCVLVGFSQREHYFAWCGNLPNPPSSIGVLDSSSFLFYPTEMILPKVIARRPSLQYAARRLPEYPGGTPVGPGWVPDGTR